MKNITNNYKQNVKLFGRQIDSKITYELDGETVELGAEELNSITPNYKSQILKSVMKQLDIDSNVEIPVGTILTYQFGVKTGNSYEYINYGNYIVKTVEKQEDLRSWKITCYDKMLYAMVDYKSLQGYVLTEDTEFIENKTYYELSNDEYIEYTGETTGNPSELELYELENMYPITIRNYINRICTKLGLTFKNASDTFANYDREIQSELYLDENGGSLGYTFRDVLDELAQVTASTICINEEDDELEIRYINELVNETSTATGINLNINNKYASSKIDLRLEGNTEQNGTPTPSSPVDIENVTGTQEINVIGKNLFDKDNTNLQLNGIYITSTKVSGSNQAKSIFIQCKSNTTYTVSKIVSSRFAVGTTNTTPETNTSIIDFVQNNSSNSITISTSSNANYLIVFYYHSNYDTLTEQEILNTIQIEENNQATSYESFKNNTYNIDLGDIELCKIGNYKDYIYKENNKYYKMPNVLKIDSYNGETITTDYLSTTGQLTTGATIYYGNNNPIAIEIIDLELIEQLNVIKLMTGINNVVVNSSNLTSPLKLTYATNCEEIDEEYLKDINVNFGEKFGPVNSIVLSRASESDNVYMRNEISVETDGLCEIKIKENQIMNFNDRSSYLPDIFNKLYNLEYYINDYNSTGITYLSLCDKYYTKVFGNRYPCIMFNDEVDITQGLQETIYTEMPEESETDYKKADKDDRKINQAYIIVNKQEQTIEGLTSSVETIKQTENNNYLELLNKFQSLDENIADITEIENIVRQLQTNTYTKTEIQEIANGTAQDGTKVSAVITTSGTFDKDGLTVEQTSADTKTNINADGMIIYDKTGSTDDPLLTVNSNGVITKNLKVSTYTEIGNNSRFEDYTTEDYEDATAVFWIGS